MKKIICAAAEERQPLPPKEEPLKAKGSGVGPQLGEDTKPPLSKKSANGYRPGVGHKWPAGV